MSDQKQQVIVIHGGNTFDSYDDYLEFLKTKELDFERMKPSPDWKDGLGTELGQGYEVLAPRMPNATFARYDEWRIWLMRIMDILQDDLILIAHSLGGVFLAKYLSENVVRKSIKATILVAAPNNDESVESLGDFTLPGSLTGLIEQGGRIILIQSRDDPVVAFEEVKRYQQQLPKAELITFEDRQHFTQERFPELTQLIRELGAERRSSKNSSLG